MTKKKSQTRSSAGDLPGVIRPGNERHPRLSPEEKGAAIDNEVDEMVERADREAKRAFLRTLDASEVEILLQQLRQNESLRDDREIASAVTIANDILEAVKISFQDLEMVAARELIDRGGVVVRDVDVRGGDATSCVACGRPVAETVLEVGRPGLGRMQIRLCRDCRGGVESAMNSYGIKRATRAPKRKR